MGHFVKDCWSRRRIKGRGNMMPPNTKDEESKKKHKGSPSEKEKKREYYLVSELSNTVITGPKTWLVDSGASKHMTSYKDIISYYKRKSFAEHVELGDDRSYMIDGVGSISFQLDFRAILHIDEVLFVSGIKKNLLSVATLEEKGYWVVFMERKAILWDKGSYLSSTEPIGTRRGGLYIVTICTSTYT